MVCKRPEQCIAITKNGTRCKNCIGPKGEGGKPSSMCNACYMHKDKYCSSKDMKLLKAQNRLYKQLGTSRTFKNNIPKSKK